MGTVHVKVAGKLLLVLYVESATHAQQHEYVVNF